VLNVYLRGKYLKLDAIGNDYVNIDNAPDFDQFNGSLTAALEYARSQGFDGVQVDDFDDAINVNPRLGGVRPNQIKSAEPMAYDDKGNVIPCRSGLTVHTDIRYQKASTALRWRKELAEGPVFVDNVIEALRAWAPKGTPEQLKAHLTKVKGAVAEADWIGLPLFLEGRRSITRGEVEQFVKDNQVTVREVVLSDEYSDSPKQRTVHRFHILNPKAPAYRELF
jgi:hypothetical protein